MTAKTRAIKLENSGIPPNMKLAIVKKTMDMKNDHPIAELPQMYLTTLDNKM
jgi:hypothetical protein